MRKDTANILAFLDAQIGKPTEDVAMDIAADFRKRRIEKNLTRERVAEESGVALSNVQRFEQKGLISLKNLLLLADTLGYLGEVKTIFSEPKYSTMEELLEIRHNAGRKTAHPKRKLKNEED